MDLSLVERKISELDRKIDLFFDNVICKRFCSGRSTHASECRYGLTRSSANGESLRQNRGLFAASTGLATRCFSPTYVVRELYCQLHCAEPFPAVRLKTVYMDFYNDGYVVNSFEVAKTQPSVSVTVKHMSQPLQFSKTKCFSVATISADVSTVELPVLQCVISSSCQQQFANECISPALSSFCDVVQPLATCHLTVSTETETDISSCAIQCSESQVPVSLSLLSPCMSVSQYDNTDLDLQLHHKRMSYHSTYFGVICSCMLSTMMSMAWCFCTSLRSINQSKVFDPGIIYPQRMDRQL